MTPIPVTLTNGPTWLDVATFIVVLFGLAASLWAVCIGSKALRVSARSLKVTSRDFALNKRQMQLTLDQLNARPDFDLTVVGGTFSTKNPKVNRSDVIVMEMLFLCKNVSSYPSKDVTIHVLLPSGLRNSGDFPNYGWKVDRHNNKDSGLLPAHYEVPGGIAGGEGKQFPIALYRAIADVSASVEIQWQIRSDSFYSPRDGSFRTLLVKPETPC